MKKLLLTIVAAAVLAGTAAAQEPAPQNDAKWSLLAGVGFDMNFDNREYSGCTFGESQTLFSSRLTPMVGIGWGEGRNRLMAAVDLRSDFGNRTKFFADVAPQVYYRFSNRKVTAYAGIFPRESMRGDYGEMILSDSMRFYDNRIQGVMGQYRGDRGEVELSVDWCGMYSEASREKFRVLSAGRCDFDSEHRFYGGYAFSMLHFAGSKLISGCVVDNMMLTPYLGVKFSAWLDFDLNLRYVQSFQRDRDNESGYRTPKGGMLQLRLAKWGLFIDEQLYMGENLQPFYSSYRSGRFPNGYGGDLYAGDTFFGTDKHIYNNLKVGYDRHFFDRTLHVKCFMAMQYDGTGWGCKQMLTVSVRLLKDIPLGRHR